MFAFGRLRSPLFVLMTALSVPLSGCATTGSGAGARVEGAVRPVDVADRDFATSVQRVLRDGKPSADRLGLLVGVVRRQLAHADRRFAEGHDVRGTDGVYGALYLVRVGEGRGEMIDATGSHALGGAIDRLAPRGDEGRTLALLRMRLPTLAPGTRERAQADEHLAALETWMHETRTGAPLLRLGGEERAAVARALIEPTDEALEAASKAVDAWISAAIYAKIQSRTAPPEPEEHNEMQRAIYAGAETLVALYLRQGDARSALEHFDKSSAIKLDHGLYAILRQVVRGDSAKDWLALAEVYEKFEGPLDADVQEAAMWGTVLEAYRRDPKLIDAAGRMAQLLVQFGMPEVAPLVLADSVTGSPPGEVRAAMTLLIGAMEEAAENEGPDAARRVYAAAPALLAMADKRNVIPSTASVRFLMASIEVRAGNLAAAEPLLREALAAEPSAAAFKTLAEVERQSGNLRGALEAVQSARSAPDAARSPLDVAEANLVGYELYRDSASAALAKQSLDAALAAALNGRQHGDAATRAHAERLLGRILQGYGETKGAARAFERALSAAAADKPTLGAAMLDAIGRALLRRDVVAARAALKKGLDADVTEDDLVYGALWVQLLERDLKTPPDGVVERALHTGSHGAWTGKLTAWANGKITDNDLTVAAQSTTQKVEAAFYTAMARKAAGDPGAEQRLRAVASSPVIDLLEVQLARELVAPALTTALPGGVQIP